MPFHDRKDAGDRLAARLGAYKGKDAVVLALPRGGVEVALPIALELGAALDLLLVRKIGVPGYPEVAMGAIVDGADPTIVRNEDFLRYAQVSEATFAAAAERELAEIERRRTRYFSGRQPTPVAGRIAIVVDDGIATGATLRAALAGLRKKAPAKIVVAVPVAPAEMVAELRAEIDEVVCLEAPADLGSVGQYYSYFNQLSDEDVIDLLDAADRAG